MSETTAQLPKWLCHKQVWAAKIHEIYGGIDEGLHDTRLVLDFGAGKEDALVKVSDAWFDKHKPETGGYYVRYEDGYESYSPAKAFEDGYERINERTNVESTAKPVEASLSAPKQAPSLGRIVLYTCPEHVRTSPDYVGNKLGGLSLPAVIVRVWDDKPDGNGCVNLKVLTDGNIDLWATSVLHGEGPSTWCWPPRV